MNSTSHVILPNQWSIFCAICFVPSQTFKPATPKRLTQPEFHQLTLQLFTNTSTYVARELALAFVLTPALTWVTKRSLNAALDRAGVKQRVPSLLAAVVASCVFGFVRMLASR